MIKEQISTFGGYCGPIVAMCSHNGNLYVATQSNIYRLTDDAWSGQTKAVKVQVATEEDKNGSQA